MRKLLVALATTAMLAAPLQANAASFEASIPKATNLDLTNTAVSINVSGIPAGQGIYFMLCEGSVAIPRPTNCSTEHQSWLSIVPATFRMGAIPALPVNEFKIASSFTTRSGAMVDCTKTSCGVLIRRDHFGTADLSLDRFFPVTFAPPRTTATATIGTFGNRVTVRVLGGEGKPLSVRIGGRWITTTLADNNVVKTFRAGRSSVNVEVFVERQRVSQQQVTFN